MKCLLITPWRLALLGCILSLEGQPLRSQEFKQEQADYVIRDAGDLDNCAEFTTAIQLIDDAEVIAKVLPKLSKFPMLRRLSLCRCDLPEGALKSVAEIAALEELDLSGADIREAELKELSAAPRLSQVDISRAKGLTGACLALLAGVRSLSVLTAVDLRIKVGAADLAGVEFANLQRLQLEHNSWATRSILDRLISGGRLNSISLYGCSMFEAIPPSISMNARLERLAIICCAAFDFSSLSLLAGCRSLQILNLSNNAMKQSDDLSILARLPLKHLSLSKIPGLTDASLAFLSSLRKLEHIDMSDNAIDGSCFEHLAACECLREVDARNCLSVTDTSLKLLHKIETLEAVNVDGCPKITEEALEEFQKALPDCSLSPTPGVGPWPVPRGWRH